MSSIDTAEIMATEMRRKLPGNRSMDNTNVSLLLRKFVRTMRYAIGEWTITITTAEGKTFAVTRK